MHFSCQRLLSIGGVRDTSIFFACQAVSRGEQNDDCSLSGGGVFACQSVERLFKRFFPCFVDAELPRNDRETYLYVIYGALYSGAENAGVCCITADKSRFSLYLQANSSRIFFAVQHCKRNTVARKRAGVDDSAVSYFSQGLMGKAEVRILLFTMCARMQEGFFYFFLPLPVICRISKRSTLTLQRAFSMYLRPLSICSGE